MTPALVALELQAILNKKALFLRDSEIDALNYAIVTLRQRAKKEEVRPK